LNERSRVSVHLKALKPKTTQKSAAVFAVRRANYTHRRKGVFNAEIIVDLRVGGNVRYRTNSAPQEHKKHASLRPLREALSGLCVKL
jgi:hypothetical protein